MTIASTVAELDTKSLETNFRVKFLFHVSIFCGCLCAAGIAAARCDFNAAILRGGRHTFWYADAYNHSWHCLFMSEAGYLHTVPRLIALFTRRSFPLAVAPLVMNLFAFFFQILPIQVFLSSRFSSISTLLRLLSCLLYVAIPNSFEIHGNATNIQWHLTLVCCMILLRLQARPDEGGLENIRHRRAGSGLHVDPARSALPPSALAVAVWWLRRENAAK